MSVDLHVLSERGIVYLRYYGYATLAESFASFESYSTHPDFHPANNHLVDFRGVTGYEHDYVKVIELQAEIAGKLAEQGYETLVVLLANSAPSREMANLVIKSWDGVSTVIPLLVDTEARALELLGQRERTLSDFLAEAREKN